MHCVCGGRSVAPVVRVPSLAHVGGPLAERRGRPPGPRKLRVGRAGLLLVARCRHHRRCRGHYRRRRRRLGASQKARLLKRMNPRCPWPVPENLRHRCS